MADVGVAGGGGVLVAREWGSRSGDGLQLSPLGASRSGKMEPFGPSCCNEKMKDVGLVNVLQGILINYHYFIFLYQI